MSAEDAIGFIRPHKRIGEKVQRSALIEDGVKGIIDDRSAIERMACPGRTFKVRHLFLLADPRARSKRGGWRKDLLAFLGRVEAKGAVIKDVSSQLTTGNPEHRYMLVEGAMKALASNGRTVHLEGKRSGRKPLVFSEADMLAAERVWLNVRKYPTEDAAAEALPKDFSTARARKHWGPRKYSQSR